MRFFIVPLFLLSACASAVVQPDWISGNSRDYADEKYLTGAGQAEYPAVARDRARADLAKIFEVTVSEQSEDVVSYSSQGSGDSRRALLESATSRNISTRTSQIISGIQIVDRWQDMESGAFHALAVLDRMQASNMLRQQITALDEMSVQAVVDARNSPNLLNKIGLYSRALQARLEREVYQKQLKIVDYSGMGVSAPISIAAVVSERDALLKRVRIQTGVEVDPLGGLEIVLKNAASSAGFTHETDGRADYLLTARLMLNEFSDAQGWYWQRGTLEIDLARLPGKEARGSKRWNIKASARDEVTAKTRVKDMINTILKQELRRTIISFGTP